MTSSGTKEKYNMNMPTPNNFQWRSPITIISLLSIIGGVTYVLFPDIIQYGMSTFADSLKYRAIQFTLYSFIHGGFLHTLSNVIFFLFIGRLVEITHGTGYIWWLWLWTTIIVWITLMMLSVYPTIGWSGFAMALLAIYTLDFYRRWSPEYKSGLLLIAINIGIGLYDNISLLGHLSGAISGLLYGLGRRK